MKLNIPQVWAFSVSVHAYTVYVYSCTQVCLEKEIMISMNLNEEVYYITPQAQIYYLTKTGLTVQPQFPPKKLDAV